MVARTDPESRSIRIGRGAKRHDPAPERFPGVDGKVDAEPRTCDARITYEIVVDAYTPEDCAIGWHCYLDDRLRFPFKAKCIADRGLSSLEKGEEVEELRTAPADDCMNGMFVIAGCAKAPRASHIARGLQREV